MRKKLVLVLLSGIFLLHQTAPIITNANVSNPVMPSTDLTATAGDYIVSVSDDANPETLGLTTDFDSAQIADGGQMDVFTTDAANRKELEALENKSQDIIIEKNILLSAASNDVMISEQDLEKADLPEEDLNWNYEMIKQPENTDVPQPENRIKVAVMDSGVDLISGLPVRERINLVADEQDITYYMEDMTGHGTAMANIISNINKNADLYSVKVLNKENQASLSSIVQGIYWCIEQDVDIINMSFGTSVKSEILQKAIDDAVDAGILMIASAGNNRGDVEYPAAFENVMAVGAVDSQAQKTAESATGAIDITAPGEDVHTVAMFGFHTWADGTSLSAAHISGAASLLWQEDHSKTNDFIKELLQESSNPLGPEQEYGSGIVDIEYALEQYDRFAVGYQKDQPQEQKTAPVIPANEHVIETYEARWGENDHKILTQEGMVDGRLILFDNDLTIVKAGAVYPDAPSSALQNKNDSIDKVPDPYWHGEQTTNYIANYRFATKQASLAGGTITKKVAGQTDAEFNRMNSQVNTTGVGPAGYKKSWSSIIPNYGSATSARQTTLRKLFLYGMSLHLATDVYAHSAYSSKASSSFLGHTNSTQSDIKTTCPNRFVDAQLAAQRTIAACYNNDIGEMTTFAPASYSTRGYYLGKLWTYANQSNYGFTEAQLQTWFGNLAFDR